MTTSCNRPPKLELLSWGEAGRVYKVSEGIVLKYSIKDNDLRICNEYRIFDLLETHPPCPDLVRSFLRLPNANFLQSLSGGTLDQRLQPRQTRDPRTKRVLKVEGGEPQCLVLRWMMELSNAVAWLESLGYAHGDIRPPNLLLDREDHLKLTDFDNTATIGTTLEVGIPPYARVLGDEGGEQRGSFGYLGPRTEQFAIGSIFYYMIRGYEPYDNEWLGERHGPIIVDRLQKMIFPKTDDNKIDTIIQSCWHGEYESIQGLLATVKLLDGVGSTRSIIMEEEDYNKRREECKQLVANRLLDMI
ncbi:kinase-like domain-containing protein [Tricladium varicosporioides]|nr:kinase-like domain-containing protein [Hymenoscyphus varicosporioides]